MPTVDHKNSFVRLVSAFSFQPEDFERLTKAVEKTDEWKPSALKEHHNDELEPDVLGFLSSDQFRHWKMDDKPLLKKDVINGQKWHFQSGRKREPHPVKLRGVELVLSGHGFGAVAFAFQPGGADFEEWLRFLCISRMKRKDTGFMVKVKVGEKPRYVPGSPEGGPFVRLSDCVEALLRSVGLCDEEASSSTMCSYDRFGPKGKMIPFFGMSVRDCPVDQMEHIRFQIARMMVNLKLAEPSPKELDGSSDTYRQVARHSWCVGTASSIGYVSINSESERWRVEMLSRMNGVGWRLFLLGLQQRVVLQQLSKQVGASWDSANARKVFLSAKVRLNRFMTAGYFPQATAQKPEFSELYGLVMHHFSVESAYRRVRDEVASLHAHHNDEHSQDLDDLVKMIGVPFALASFVLAILGVNIQDWTAGTGEGLQWISVFAWTLGSIAFGFGGSWLWHRRFSA